MTNHTYMHLKLHTINYYTMEIISCNKEWYSSCIRASGKADHPLKETKFVPTHGFKAADIHTQTQIHVSRGNVLPFSPQPTYRLLESIKLGHAPVIRHYLHLVASCNSHPFQVRNVRVVDLNYFAALGGFEKYPVRLDFQTPKVLEHNNTQIISTRF